MKIKIAKVRSIEILDADAGNVVVVVVVVGLFVGESLGVFDGVKLG